MLQSFRNRSDYPFWFEVAPLLLTTAILMVQFFIFKDYTPHVPLIIGICITGLFMSLKGRKWIDMEHNMYRVMKVALPTMVIIMCVGMVIASWIAAGTVPTILDFGLGMLSPRIFLPATCILATVVSLATGTSWGTVGTVGLAIMGIAQALGVPEYWAAGAVVSGAFFGDKMSPLSDTTNLTPAVAGTDLWSHIRSMLTNTIPAYALTIIIYTWVGMDYGTGGGMGSLEMREAIQNTVQSHFQLGWVTLIPPVVVIYMGFRKYSVMGTLCTGIFIGALIAVFYQGVSLDKISGILMNGYTATTGQEYVDKLLTKGGILNMGWVITMMFLSLAFVGVLEAYGTFHAILLKINKVIASRFSLVLTSAGSVLTVGMVAGIGVTELIDYGMTMAGMNADTGGGPGNLSIFRHPTVSLGIATSATVLLIIAGVAAGYFPARKAVSIPAVEAMRGE